MQTLWQDLRYGARMLMKQKSFTLIAMATLALGIGANTALFSLFDKLFVAALPVKDPEALVQVKAESVNPQTTWSEFAWADFQDYRAQNQVFSEMTAFKQTPVNLGEGDQLERVRAESVAENYFVLFGVQPLLGRFFTAAENRAPGAHPVAVLSYSLWQSRFGGAAEVVGQSVTLNELRYTIIGVTPARFRGVLLDAPSDVWTPAMMIAQLERRKYTDEWLNKREWALWKLFARLKPGVTPQAAQPAMDALAQQVRDAWMPVSDRKLPFNEKHIKLDDVAEGLSELRGEFGTQVLMIFGIAGVILLMACANLANLLLARAGSRRKEIAVRLALGAGRGRLIRQLLTESLLLATLGGVTGAWLAPWLTDLLLAFQAKYESAQVIYRTTLNGRVALFTVGLSLLTGVLFGLLPAWQASRPDLIPALKDEGGQRADGRGFTWSRRALIVAQVALSVVVLVTAGLFVRSLDKLFAIELGFNPDRVLLAEIELPSAKYDEARGEGFYQQLRERLQALPGVQSVALTDYTPLSGSYGLTTVVIEGQSVNQNDMPTVDLNRISAGYHELMGIAVRQGRSFAAADRKGQPEVATINEAFAQKFFPAQNPVGHRLSLGTGMPWLTIVGVTRNLKSKFVTEETSPQLELPLAQRGLGQSQRVLLRTAADPQSLLPQVRREVRALDASLAFFKTTTLQNEVRAHLASWRMAATLTSLFGAVALLLVAIGLYGLLAYAVAQRTREIGIRMALGAQASDVLRLVLREGVSLIGAGLLLGLAAAFAATRLIEAFLYGVSAHDPLTFVVVALLLLAVALLACWIPARRATRVDPIIALRCE